MCIHVPLCLLPLCFGIRSWHAVSAVNHRFQGVWILLCSSLILRSKGLFLCHYVIEADCAHADRSNSADQRHSQHTHTHTLCPLHYPPYSSPLSPPPLSPAFQQGNSMLSNFCQMSNTSLPSSAALFPLFLTPIGWAETMNPLPPPRFTYCSQQPNMNPRTQAGEAAALPKQKGMPKQINFPHCMMQC